MSKLLNSSTVPAALLCCAFAVPAFAAGPNVVNAELWNKPDGSQGLTLSTYQIKPGKVVFHVKNISTDEDHELLLVKTDLSPNDLAMDADGVRSDRRNAGSPHRPERTGRRAPRQVAHYEIDARCR